MYTVAVVAEQPTWRAGLEKLAGDDPNLRVASAVSDVGELTGASTWSCWMWPGRS